MLLNLYVGVIFSQFSRIRNLSETGSAFLTHEQNEWVELSRMVFKLTPPDKASLPTGKRLFWYRLVHSKVWSADASVLEDLLRKRVKERNVLQ